MRSRALILAVVLAVAAAAIVAGVAVAGQSDPLPDITAPELLAKMAAADGPDAVSGDIAWSNVLFGDLASSSAMEQLPAQSPLTSSGSGRIWVSDAGVRAESQGGGGDQIVVLNKAERTAWVYDDAQGTVKKVTATGALDEAPAETASPAPDLPLLTPEAISLYLRQAARLATAEVTGQTRVAGRDAYQLRMTPAADDTALGYIEAAVDGETMLPLQVSIVARGGVEPVLRYGFTSVSYDPIDASVFTFSPPEGTTVTTEAIDLDEVRAELEKHSGDVEKPTAAQRAKAAKLLRRALLTRDQVAKLVEFRLAYPRDYTARPFQWGGVLGANGPVIPSKGPLLEALAAAVGMDSWADASGGFRSRPNDSIGDPPSLTSVLFYGQGFGTIALAQTQTTAELRDQLDQAGQASQLLGTTTVDGAQALEIGTPLGGFIVWQRGGTTLIAGGMVPMSDLEAFAGSVR